MTTSARVTLSRRELLFLTSFVENVDQSTWSDHLLVKLEHAIARIDGKKPGLGPKAVEWIPDQRRALCRACGWTGTVSKATPCPTCGRKVNPLLFDERKP